MHPRNSQGFAALISAVGLAGCSVSGVAQNGACEYFGGTCYADFDCCGGLTCSEAQVCAYPLDADGGSGSSGGSGSGASSSSGAASSSSSSGSSGSTSSSGSGFSVAAHSEPSVPNAGGPIIAQPVLITITYSNDTNRSIEEAFDAFLVTSNWLATVGPEYGIEAGTNVNAELTDAAPASLDQDGVASDLAALIQAGTVPGLAGTGGVTLQNAIYMIFYPNPQTTALTVNGEPLCQFANGYHEEGTLSGGQSFTYGVVQDCPPSISITDAQTIEWATSHEFFESATDPLPMSNPAWVISDTSNPWHALGGEVADLCEAVLPQWSEGGYDYIQRIFSNAAAAAGGDPCAPPVGSYYSTDAEPQGSAPESVPEVSAGSQVVFTLTGWSTAAVANWNVATGVYAGTFTPTISSSVATLNNGLTGTLTVGVPTNTASGDYAVIEVGSELSPSNNTAVFIGIAVP